MLPICTLWKHKNCRVLFTFSEGIERGYWSKVGYRGFKFLLKRSFKSPLSLICGFGHIWWRNSWWKTSFFTQFEEKAKTQIQKIQKLNNIYFSIAQKVNFWFKKGQMNITIQFSMFELVYKHWQKLLRLAIFSLKNPKKIFHLLKDAQNSPFPLTQCYAKPEKAMPGSACQEWAGRLATNIANGGRGCESHNFFTDCLQN